MNPRTFSTRGSLALLLLLLAACAARPAASSAAAEKRAAEATVAAIFVQTELARPTRTATLPPTLPPTETPLPPTATSPAPASSATPAPPVIRATPRAGLELYAHPEIPAYVLQFDPAIWEPDEATGHLAYRNMGSCRVEPGSGQGLAQPTRLLWQDLGRFRWEILDYGEYALAVPTAGNGISGADSAYLRLEGYNQPGCRREHLKILTNLMTRAEAQGEIAFAAFVSPTPRAPIEGAACGDMLPSRLSPGDYVAVSTDALWMRSEPRADEGTKTRRFARYAPYQIRVTGAPVCEKYLYWPVEVFEVGKDTSVDRGWLAEGDANEYYMVPVK